MIKLCKRVFAFLKCDMISFLEYLWIEIFNNAYFPSDIKYKDKIKF